MKRLLSVDPLLAHCQDEDGYTPLHRAAYGGHAATASTLLPAGTEVNSRTADGWTPLHGACRWGQVATARPAQRWPHSAPPSCLPPWTGLRPHAGVPPIAVLHQGGASEQKLGEGQ